ncbi:MAG: NADH-quinone oxidoreductase subunit A [Cystobacterineae bacterium]|nr:NADH-quinone oxidoreductase subunit A [Cystobacterineae bacterium]
MSPVEASPLTPYIPIAVTLLVAGLMAAAIPLVAGFLGSSNPNATKQSTFECGNIPTGSPWQRFPVKFYVVAILFIVFDIEAVFIYPWAVNFKALGWFGYAVMAMFAATLLVGLAYIWKKGALDWEED